jgi:cytochrome P450
LATAIAQQALDDIRSGGNSFDLVSAFAKRVPRDAFMSLFGIPPGKAARIENLVDTIFDNFDRTLPAANQELMRKAATEIYRELWALREGCPANASSGLFCMMKDTGESLGLTLEDVVATGINFALGGYLSTQFLISTGVYNLLRDGGVAMKRLQGDGRLLPNAIAEMLRFDAPFQMADRFTSAEQTILGGVNIEKDANVVVVYGSANRDESVFKDAGKFDIDRAASAESYGLGHGIHYCIGAPLVNIVAPIAFGALLKTLPTLRLGSGTPDWLTDPYFRSFRSLALDY